MQLKCMLDSAEQHLSVIDPSEYDGLRKESATFEHNSEST